MGGRIKVKRRVIVEFDEADVEWLKGIMQNKLSDYESEDAALRRKKLWDILSEEGKAPSIPAIP